MKSKVKVKKKILQSKNWKQRRDERLKEYYATERRMDNIILKSIGLI